MADNTNIENTDIPDIPELPEPCTLTITTSPAEAEAVIEGLEPAVNGAKKVFTIPEQGTVTAVVSLDGYVTQTKTINCTSATKSTTITNLCNKLQCVIIHRVFAIKSHFSIYYISNIYHSSMFSEN